MYPIKIWGDWLKYVLRSENRMSVFLERTYVRVKGEGVLKRHAH
jgi:hypothetical protein